MQWILLVLVISIVIGALRGGKLRNLTEIRVNAWWLLPIAFLLLMVPFKGTRLGDIFLDRGWVNYAESFLFFWGLTILALKSKLRHRALVGTCPEFWGALSQFHQKAQR